MKLRTFLNIGATCELSLETHATQEKASTK